MIPWFTSKSRHKTWSHDLDLLAQKGATLSSELSPGIHPSDGLIGLEADKHVGKEALHLIDVGRFEKAQEVVPGGAKSSISPPIPPKRMCNGKFVDRSPIVEENHDWRSREIDRGFTAWLTTPPQPDAGGEDRSAIHKSLCSYPDSFGFYLKGVGAVRGYDKALVNAVSMRAVDEQRER